MKFLRAAAATAAFLAGSVHGADTPYGSCPERAQTYQERYQSSMRSGDLVCYQKALERELGSSSGYNCPGSSQSYQQAYERTQKASDLICFQQALERELR